MPGSLRAPVRPRDWRHWERWLTLAYLAVLGGTLAALAVRPVRVGLLEQTERAVRWWDDRWTRRLERGERLLASARYEEAAAYLARLDLRFPARGVKHGRDRERERLLAALGTAFAAQDRKRLALAALTDLVRFDERNYRNHFQLARAALRFDEPDLAREELLRVLEIHPSHLPSVTELARMQFDAGRYAEVVTTVQTYLEARRWVDLPVDGPGWAGRVRSAVDGQGHWTPVGSGTLPDPAVFRIAAGGYGIAVDSVAYAPAFVPGRVSAASAGFAVAASNLDILSTPTRLRPSADTVVLSVGALAGRVGRLDAHLRVLIPMDPALWSMVVQSLENLLRMEEIEGLARWVYLTDAPPEPRP